MTTEEMEAIQERIRAEMIHGAPLIIYAWGPDLSRLWDGAAQWAALEHLRRVLAAWDRRQRQI